MLATRVGSLAGNIVPGGRSNQWPQVTRRDTCILFRGGCGMARDVAGEFMVDLQCSWGARDVYKCEG
jgi:hypothetical protein